MDKLIHWLGIRAPRFNLLRWFSVLSLLCIGAACVVSSYLLSGFLTRQMLHRDGVVIQELVQSVTDIENLKARAAGREPDVRDRGMHELFDHLAGLPDMLRTNIYATDQTLAWSSDKNLIGKRFNANRELEEALSGKMEIETGQTGRREHPKHEHMFLSDKPVTFVETYLPLLDRKTGKVIGVAELYRIPNALLATIEQGRRLIWLTAMASGLVLFLALFWIVRRGDRTIREQQARLIESETFAAVGEMSSAVAHGIRNPLASIRSSAELCIEETTPPATRESLQDIIAQVDRLEQWLRDLLGYAQLETGEAASLALGPLVQKVWQDHARDAEKGGIVMNMAIAQGLPSVIGDAGAFEQVLSNILVNAMEAMPRGGRLNIEAIAPARGMPLSLKIADSGVGISEAQQAKLFSAFQTSKPKGLGLGLALARRIMRRFGGDVLLESKPGLGTTVELRFATSTTAEPA